MNTNLATSTAPTRLAWLNQAEFPFTSRRLTVDGHLIHYLDEGVGPTMVFVDWKALRSDGQACPAALRR